MPRPRKKRCIGLSPRVTYFKPRGIPLNTLEEVDLNHDEFESIRLKYVMELDQIECAKMMKVSQSTFQRILVSANKKIAEAVVNGKAIKIIT
ncbi:DUF134 domain-containing protein [Candidatus Peregrinibacteria bacterium]|nr:DUF134 domain-containing protein [Candidatus Peregrinibacteria bacterium]